MKRNMTFAEKVRERETLLVQAREKLEPLTREQLKRFLTSKGPVKSEKPEVNKFWAANEPPVQMDKGVVSNESIA